jgi:hypothetical protein
MSDDLVKRLRSLGSAGPGRISFLASEDAMKAADRIEKDAAHIDEMYELVAAMNADHTASKTRIEMLEAALRELSCKCTSNCDWERDDTCSSWVARKALEGKDD